MSSINLKDEVQKVLQASGMVLSRVIRAGAVIDQQLLVAQAVASYRR